MSVSGEPSGYDVPDWAAEPIKRFLSDTRRVQDITEISTHGIRALTMMPKLVNVLSKRTTGLLKADDAESAKELAELARREVESGFPLVYANAVVSLWSRLESLVREFLVVWITKKPELLGAEPFSKLRIRLGEYVVLGEIDRGYYLVELLEQEIGAGIRNGVARFECLLKAIGLDGAVPSRLQRDMFEFGQVRTAVVHGGGKVDARLVGACPWLGFEAGEDLIVSGSMFGRYGRGAGVYVCLLVGRVGEVFGVAGPELQADMAEIIKEYEESRA